jgi:hypothetical protein
MPESERKPAPDRRLKWTYPYPKPPPNGLVLKEYLRPIYRDGEGRLRPTPGESGADYMWLTEAERLTLIPANPKPGQTFPLHEPIWKRLFPNQFYHYNLCSHLTPSYDNEKMKPTFTLTVESVAAGEVRLRLDGAAAIRLGCWEGEQNKGEKLGDLDFRMLGRITVDLKRRAVTRCDLVGVGDLKFNPDHKCNHFSGFMRPPDPRPFMLAIAFELGSGTSADMAPPKYRQYGEEAYFGPKKG